MNNHDVQGYCPMGCGRTLMLGYGGYVTCTWVECPRPERASELMCAWPRGIAAEYSPSPLAPIPARPL